MNLMLKDIQPFISKIDDLLGEISTYKRYKEKLLKRLDMLYSDYQAGKYTYIQYQRLAEKLLKGKTRKEWIEYYDSYIYSLLKKVEYSNSQIFYIAFKDRSYLELSKMKVPENMPVPEPEKVRVRRPRFARPKKKEKKEKHAEKRKDKKQKPLEVSTEPVSISAEEAEPMVEAARAEEPVEPEEIQAETMEVKPEPSKAEEQAPAEPTPPSEEPVEIAAEQAGRPAKSRRVPWEKEEKQTARAGKRGAEEAGRQGMKKKKAAGAPRYTLWQRIRFAFSPREKESAFERILTEEGENVKLKKKPKLMKFGPADLVKNMIDRFRADREVIIADKTLVTHSVLELAQMEKEEMKALKAAKLDVEELAEEAKRMRRIAAEKKAIKVYKPSLIGTVSNLTVRRLTLFFIDKFPEFFKNFYTQMRYANIKLLSNTYINIMFFMTIVSFFAALPLWFIFFYLRFYPMIMIIIRGVLMSLLTSAAVAFAFYYYPISKINRRTRDINTNLPFAIDHMSAVASSGVNPTAMFKLIAISEEYGDICGEIQKIVDFIELFGYDLITAVKSISSTTPSARFKEFLEGIVSTIETGGDIQGYLSQKSGEAMLAYRLERKKYTDTISTYSDVYTGILVAAPLFFVAALSLVSVLGGTIGGYDVDVLVAFGTYAIIPLLNIFFIIFLEINQPKV
ncbi:hypothetical protein GF351_02570 [Candidatus Woesearchaeota archaeon]|nr:hypothetical protein [Candidatus Woesearchaeota archaeon]